MVKVPISLLWNDAKTTTIKDDITSKSGGKITKTDENTDWTKLTETKKQELIKLYYTSEEQTEVKIADLDKLGQDKLLQEEKVIGL